MMIGSLSRYLTITIFFHVFAVLLSIDIITFKACSILVYLHSRSIGLAILIHPSESIAIGIVDEDLSIHLALAELALKHILVFLNQFAGPVLDIIFPLARIQVTIVPPHGTLSILHSFLELAGVLVTI